MAEARKAVSASMTAEGMRQQNEALRWALRAPSLGMLPGMHGCLPEAGDESALYTGSDESGARSAATTGEMAVLHCINAHLPCCKWAPHQCVCPLLAG